MDRTFVEVALPLPFEGTFTYSIAGPRPPVGTRVLVPFRREERIGWVVGLGRDPDRSGIRGVLDTLEREPSLSKGVLALCEWMAGYYIAPLGLAIRTALPAVLSDASRDYLSLAETAPSGVSSREARLLAALATHSGPQRVRSLRKSLGMGSIWPEIRSLVDRGGLVHRTLPPRPPPVKMRRMVKLLKWIEALDEVETTFRRARRQREAYEQLASNAGILELAHLTGQHGFSRAVITGLEEKGVAEVVDEEVMRDPFAARPAVEPARLSPTPKQAGVIQRLHAALDEGAPRPFLLHGITGSGKTLVYIELLREVLKRGGSGIVLVPEIALTPQTVTRFRSHFGDAVAVLHSGLSAGERYDAWRQLRSGERRIAVGARSALMAPLENLGAIVVDEEHDGSYKQGETPRYHARDLAVVRAAQCGAVCVLGSATPSLESWSNVERNKFEILTLPERVGGGTLPPVRVIDLREVRARAQKDRKRSASSEAGVVLSPPLVEAISDRLRKKEQTILLLNRRGYSAFIQCRECGEVEQCPNCAVSLTYHRASKRLVCHHCRHEVREEGRCPRCGGEDLSRRGLGTEQVERVVTEVFPTARLARMDVDTTSGKWAHHEILERVERREVDILLGTQMIAKGLDFPGVTLVGVVNADVGLHLPDFRASERTFQLLSQVAGRAGRGVLGGEVLIQTAVPEHYVIQAALQHDYEGFAKRELKERLEPRYPPHNRLINVVVSSPDPELAASGAEKAARWARNCEVARTGGVEVVGPAPCPIERLHGRARWHFLLRSASARDLGEVARGLRHEVRPTGGDVRMILDRDPTALL